MAQKITTKNKANRYNMNTAERKLNNYIPPYGSKWDGQLQTDICVAENEEKNEKSTWKKILNFIIEVLKLIVTAFLGASGAANIFN